MIPPAYLPACSVRLTEDDIDEIADMLRHDWHIGKGKGRLIVKDVVREIAKVGKHRLEILPAEGGLAYLATPYTNYPEGIEFAFREAARLCAELVKANVAAYSPIAHCHPLAVHGDMDPLDRDFWLGYQRKMMARCDALIVATMKSWDASIGIQYEVEFFAAAGRPIFHLDPNTMRIRQVREATK